MPDPALDEREFNEIQTLAKRYEKLTSPGALAKAGKQIGEAVPAPVKDLANKAGKAAKDTLNGLTEQELMANAIKAAAEGFGELEKQAAKASVSREYVISRINEGKQEQKVSSLSEICLLRAYDVAAVSANERLHHMGIALVEGGSTGAAGFWGLPANLALSMLIYFRAVQSVAMFYGYDVKDDPSELVIASEVFQSAPRPQGESRRRERVHRQGSRLRGSGRCQADREEGLVGDGRAGRRRPRDSPDPRACPRRRPQGGRERRQEGARGRGLQEGAHPDRAEDDARNRREDGPGHRRGFGRCSTLRR